jgi:hypothetical protein
VIPILRVGGMFMQGLELVSSQRWRVKGMPEAQKHGILEAVFKGKAPFCADSTAAKHITAFLPAAL